MKEKYIRQVKRQLRTSDRVKQEILRDLEEIFSSALEHGETEQQVLERLGKPREFADNAAEQFGVDNRRKRRQQIGITGGAAAALLIAALWLQAPVIFQRGNPIPYLIAAAGITEETPYVQVKVQGGCTVYISRRGQCPALLEAVERSRGVELVEQGGSGYLFSNGADRLTVSSEVYWRHYTVWQVPDSTLAAGTEQPNP